jgi:hypothetical protein
LMGSFWSLGVVLRSSPRKLPSGGPYLSDECPAVEPRPSTRGRPNSGRRVAPQRSWSTTTSTTCTASPTGSSPCLSLGSTPTSGGCGRRGSSSSSSGVLATSRPRALSIGHVPVAMGRGALAHPRPGPHVTHWERPLAPVLWVPSLAIERAAPVGAESRSRCLLGNWTSGVLPLLRNAKGIKGIRQGPLPLHRPKVLRTSSNLRPFLPLCRRVEIRLPYLGGIIHQEGSFINLLRKDAYLKTFTPLRHGAIGGPR